ncbi:hypothetical protein ACOSP7_031883 [Xanthoceras sorbifolium]
MGEKKRYGKSRNVLRQRNWSSKLRENQKSFSKQRKQFSNLWIIRLSNQLSAVRPGRYIPIVCGKFKGDNPLTPGGLSLSEFVSRPYIRVLSRYMHATQHSAHRQ